tara:strand:+ start:351 stop:578 length:228 start_codon:yes stop_codon:yes gene_type:complete
MKKKEKFNLEVSLNTLESLIKKMESDSGTLEENLNWFEEGMNLIDKCQKKLKSAEQRVYDITKNSQNDFELKEKK